MTGFLFAISFAVIAVFVWQAMPDSLKETLRRTTSHLAKIGKRGGKVGLSHSKTVFSFLRQPRTLVYLVPVLVVTLALWWGAESNPLATGTFLAGLSHPPLLIGSIIVLIWLTKSSEQLDQSFLRKFGAIALLWGCAWYSRYYLPEAQSSTIALALAATMAIVSHPLVFGAAVAAATWRDKSETLSKGTLLKGVATVVILWTGLGFLAQYIGTSYIPNASAETLDRLRTKPQRSPMAIENVSCFKEDHFGITGERSEYHQVFHPYVRCKFYEYEILRPDNDHNMFLLMEYNRFSNTWKLRTDERARDWNMKW